VVGKLDDSRGNALASTRIENGAPLRGSYQARTNKCNKAVCKYAVTYKVSPRNHT
jgi:hypothetical protein